MPTSVDRAASIGQRLLARNDVLTDFFAREAVRLAAACQEMSERFLRGGRLLAFGRGPYATDAQHVAVEFVHPVIVGKRALPALDISQDFAPRLAVLVGRDDIVMGFGPPEGDGDVAAALAEAADRGAMTFALPGDDGSYAIGAATPDPFIHQELIEVLYHALWESVHVFFERRELGHDAGAASFLYPFLGDKKQDAGRALEEVAASILLKVRDDADLRAAMAADEARDPRIARAAAAMLDRVKRGGKLLIFGNGGSATDANDWALDCVRPAHGLRPIPALSLAAEPATMSAIANDVGAELIFLRQIAAYAAAGDVAIAISTSGGSRNLVAALEDARKRGLLTVALVGHDGGEILRRGLADHVIVVRSDQIPRVQEVHASIYHAVREAMG